MLAQDNHSRAAHRFASAASPASEYMAHHYGPSYTNLYATAVDPYAVPPAGNLHQAYTGSTGSAYPHDMNASAAAVASNQDSGYYSEDGVYFQSQVYTGEYLSQFGDGGAQWAKDDSAFQAHPPFIHSQPLSLYHDLGDVSPASDGSSSALFDSPPQNDAASFENNTYPTFGNTYQFDQQQEYSGPSAPAPSFAQQVPCGGHRRSRHGSSHEHEHPHASHGFIPEPQPGSYDGSAPFDPQGLFNVHISEDVPEQGLFHPQVGYQQQYTTTSAVPRAQSPMAHLPYEDKDAYPSYPRHARMPSRGNSTSIGQHHAERGALYHPYPPPSAPRGSQQVSTVPLSRSPPLVEDQPKKPLTLACLFCRKRKIACGSPPPGRGDRTCNQCARRNLECVYPVVSRRGVRSRSELESPPLMPEQGCGSTHYHATRVGS